MFFIWMDTIRSSNKRKSKGKIDDELKYKGSNLAEFVTERIS